jgi:hypothetical protein
MPLYPTQQQQPSASPGMMSAPGPTAPPAYNRPIDWSQRAPMPPSAGGVNTTGPGQYAPSANGQSMPGLPDKGLTISGSNIGNQFKNGIRNGLDPAGILGGERNPFKQAGNIVRNSLDPAGIFSNNDPKKVKGHVDPVTGTYVVENYGKNKDAISAAATEYLRTGNIPPSMKHMRGMFTGVKNQIRDQLAHGGEGGGAWQWGTPSAGAPTTIPGQGPVNWGNGAQQPLGQAPAPGVQAPPAGGAQLPGADAAGPGSLTPPAGSPSPGAPPVSWTTPPQLPSPAAYNPQAAVAEALRKPTGGGSKLVGGYTGP